MIMALHKNGAKREDFRLVLMAISGIKSTDLFRIAGV